jgi:hypothetical protein
VGRGVLVIGGAKCGYDLAMWVFGLLMLVMMFVIALSTVIRALRDGSLFRGGALPGDLGVMYEITLEVLLPALCVEVLAAPAPSLVGYLGSLPLLAVRLFLLLLLLLLLFLLLLPLCVRAHTCLPCHAYPRRVLAGTPAPLAMQCTRMASAQRLIIGSGVAGDVVAM